MKHTLALVALLVIWEVIILVGLIISYFTHQITLGSYYIGLMGCGIWLTLINIYIDKE